MYTVYVYHFILMTIDNTAIRLDFNRNVKLFLFY